VLLNPDQFVVVDTWPEPAYARNGIQAVWTLSVSHRWSRVRGAPVTHAGGQDLLGLDALVGGFVVVGEQALVEQEAPSGGLAGNARRRPPERGATELVAGRLQVVNPAMRCHPVHGRLDYYS
jgi:hypothetical protein